MWINPFPVTWWSERAYIELPGDGLHTLDRLRMRMTGWSPSTWTKDGCFGRIKRDRIRIQRYRAYRRYGSEILLAANYKEMGGKPVIVGEFRTSWFARLVETLWFIVVIAFIPLCFVGAAMTWQTDHWNAVILAILPPALFTFGRGIQALGASHREEDKAYIERFILDASEGRK